MQLYIIPDIDFFEFIVLLLINPTTRHKMQPGGFLFSALSTQLPKGIKIKMLGGAVISRAVEHFLFLIVNDTVQGNWLRRIKIPFIFAEKPCNTAVLLHFSSRRYFK